MTITVTPTNTTRSYTGTLIISLVCWIAQMLVLVFMMSWLDLHLLQNGVERRGRNRIADPWIRISGPS